MSIVVLSYTEKRLSDLRILLASIEEQTYPALELVFVVERSVAISKFLSDWKSKYPKRIYFTERKISVAESRNLAAKIATGDVIAFVDDDARLLPGWADEIAVAFCSYPSAIGVTGVIIPDWEIVSDAHSFPKSLYWMIGCTAWRDTHSVHYIDSAQTLNTGYRREVFRDYRFRIRMYKDDDSASLHSGLQGDDVDFALRVTNGTARKLLYDPRLVVRHKVPHSRVSLGFVKRYAFWQGATEARYRRMKLANERKTGAFVPLFRTLVDDLFGGSWCNLRLRAIVVLALCSFGFGYLRYAVAVPPS